MSARPAPLQTSQQQRRNQERERFEDLVLESQSCRSPGRKAAVPARVPFLPAHFCSRSNLARLVRSVVWSIYNATNYGFVCITGYFSAPWFGGNTGLNLVAVGDQDAWRMVHGFGPGTGSELSGYGSFGSERMSAASKSCLTR